MGANKRSLSQTDQAGNDDEGNGAGPERIPRVEVEQDATHKRPEHALVGPPQNAPVHDGDQDDAGQNAANRDVAHETGLQECQDRQEPECGDETGMQGARVQC